jgi:hypothetical protein
VIKVQPSNAQQQFSTIECSTNRSKIGKHIFIEIENQNYITNRTKPFKCPYQVGQKIFAKESFNIFAGQVTYKQNLANAERHFWKPASQMKQEHSRLTLQIKEIRVESLLDISEEDCYKEGIDYSPECCQNYIAVPDWNGNPTPSCCNNPNLKDPRPAFAENWNATYKKPEEKRDSNPYVWVIKFEVVK